MGGSVNSADGGGGEGVTSADMVEDAREGDEGGKGEGLEREGKRGMVARRRGW